MSITPSSAASIAASPARRRHKTGVSLEPEVVRTLDALAAQAGLNRSWVLNAIVREYLRIAAERGLTPPLSREAIIQM